MKTKKWRLKKNLLYRGVQILVGICMMSVLLDFVVNTLCEHNSLLDGIFLLIIELFGYFAITFIQDYAVYRTKRLNRGSSSLSRR